MSIQVESVQIVTRPGNDTGVGTVALNADGTGINAVSPVKMMQDSNILHDKVMLNIPLSASTVSTFQHIVREGRWQLAAASVYFQTGSTSGTLNVSVDTGTNAPGAGTAQLSANISLAAASQQTVINGALTGSLTTAGPGDRFSIVIGGTMTSLANGMLNMSIKRVG